MIEGSATSGRDPSIDLLNERAKHGSIFFALQAAILQHDCF
jgi:hypothetical protein